MRKTEGRRRRDTNGHGFLLGQTLCSQSLTRSSMTLLDLWPCLALALRYLHERGPPIVHFNVCSENVLIDNVGRGVWVDSGSVR